MGNQLSWQTVGIIIIGLIQVIVIALKIIEKMSVRRKPNHIKTAKCIDDDQCQTALRDGILNTESLKRIEAHQSAVIGIVTEQTSILKMQSQILGQVDQHIAEMRKFNDG